MISVVIPNYNRAELLYSAIKSVLEQTIEVSEIIICDDGSTDNSFTIVESFKNDKIKWISLTHSGMPAVPRNHGIKISKGQWIAFLDSDDTWSPRKIENQLYIINKYGCSAVCTAIIDENISKVKSETQNVKIIDFFDLLKSNEIICSSVLISRKIIEKAGFFSEASELRAIEDYEFWLRISAICKWYKNENPDTFYTEYSIDSIRLKESTIFHKQQLRVFKSFIFWSKLKYLNKTIIVVIKYLMIRFYLLKVKVITKFQ